MTWIGVRSVINADVAQRLILSKEDGHERTGQMPDRRLIPISPGGQLRRSVNRGRRFRVTWMDVESRINPNSTWNLAIRKLWMMFPSDPGV